MATAEVCNVYYSLVPLSLYPCNLHTTTMTILVTHISSVVIIILFSEYNDVPSENNNDLDSPDLVDSGYANNLITVFHH